ncbi:MAG: hypothetical protein GXO01_00330 [Epsilonproteobacteria bacterium]|nr:hypothetical protein [Campylobacterota bacterium]
MKHIELLNLLCRHRKILDSAYKNKKLLSVPQELIEIGLFNKVGGFYYLNEIYFTFVDTLLARADFSYIAEDFDKELKKLIELKEEYKLNKSNYLRDLIFKLLNRIYQGMKNRDKRLLGLIEKLENDEVSELEFLIKEARSILKDVEEIMVKNEMIVSVFEGFMEFGDFKEFVKDILLDIIHLNQNVDSYLKRLREFITQTEKKRRFNQKLFKIAHLIINEDNRIDNFLITKRFVIKQKFEYVPDSAYVNYEKIREIIGKFTKERKIKHSHVKRDLEEVINLIDLKGLIKSIEGSEDIFKSIIAYVGKIDKELLNESVRVFVYILNHFDKKLTYTKEYNEFNVRVVKWKA